MKTVFLTGILAILLAGLVVYRMSAAAAFNAMVPKDNDAAMLAADVAYGPAARHKLDVYGPPSPGAGLPVVVFVHGGSWNTGNKNAYGFVATSLAARGFLVFVINYRLHPEHPFPAFVEDTARAINWVQHNAPQYGGRAGGLAVMGHSAGAYNAVLAVLDKKYLAAFGNDGSAIKAMVSLAGPLDFLPLDKGVAEETFAQVKDLPSTQPITFVRADAPPILLLHGQNDTTCKPRNSVNLHAALKAKGAQATLVLYNDLAHVGIIMAVAKPFRHWAPVLDDVTAFLAEKLEAQTPKTTSPSAPKPLTTSP